MSDWLVSTIVSMVGAGAGWVATAVFTWVPQQRDFELALRPHLQGNPAQRDRAAAVAKVEAQGHYEPNFWWALWQSSMVPLVVYAIVMLAGTGLSTDSTPVVIALFVAFAVLLFAVVHEFVFRERGPNWWRWSAVIAAWLCAAGLTGWIQYESNGAAASNASISNADAEVAR